MLTHTVQFNSINLCAILALLWSITTTTTVYGFKKLKSSHFAPTISTCDKQTVQWTGGDFDFPCTATRSIYRMSNKLIQRNVLATRAQLNGQTMFLAMPRFRPGVPASLVKAKIAPGRCSAAFTAYPNWELHEEGNCKALQSVVDLVLDAFKVLWVLDTGIVNVFDNPIRKCPPKVLAISTRTGKVLKTITLDGLAKPTSRLQYLAIDYAPDGSCYVYVSDAANHLIIVYDLYAERGFRVVLPDAVAAGYNQRDVLFMSLVRQNCGTTELYFTYLSGQSMYSLRTDYLRKGLSDGRIIDVGHKPARFVVLGTDNGSAMFLRKEGQPDVYRWNTNSTFQESNFKAVYRSETCQLATHVMPDYDANCMRVLQSNFPDYLANRLGCGVVHQLTLMHGCQ